jgi:hypothetical protein
MLTVNPRRVPHTMPRRVFAAALLAVSLTVLAGGCGEKGQPGGGPAHQPVDRPPVSTLDKPSSSGGKAASARVVYFSSTAPTTAGVHQVLRDHAELGRFAGQVAARDPKTAAGITATGTETDFSRDVLVGWTTTTGCSAATTAALDVSGDRLSLRISRPDPPQECLRAFQLTVVFKVPKEGVPARPVFR